MRQGIQARTSDFFLRVDMGTTAGLSGRVGSGRDGSLGRFEKGLVSREGEKGYGRVFLSLAGKISWAIGGEADDEDYDDIDGRRRRMMMMMMMP